VPCAPELLCVLRVAKLTNIRIDAPCAVDLAELERVVRGESKREVLASDFL
jgi:hypothetical protein